DLLLYRGLIATQRGDATAAWDALVAAATIDPTRILDPLRFPPRAVDAFERATEAVGQAARGQLSVDVPAGCTTVIDARAHATTALRQAEHFVRVECPGATPYGAVAALSAAEQTLTPTLAPSAAPADADLLPLAAGRHAGSLLVAEVTSSPGAPPTLWL